MLQFPQNVTVDLNVELTNNVINSIHVNQYEHKSREINIYVKKDGIDYPIPNDLTVNIRIHKTNGYDIYKTIGKDIGVINGNIITIIIDESMTIASGRQTCDIEFIDSNGNRLYSTKFYINVHKSALDDNNIKDEDDYSTIQSLARESKEYANLSKSYAVGTEDEVRKNDSTDNAKYYKEQSEINANNAANSSATATEKASEASQSATNASNSATIATNKAKESSDSANLSKSYKEQTSNSASNASASANTATQKANEASVSATNAKNSADKAKASETASKASQTAAKTSETNAASSASTAMTKANEASTSASQAATSASNAAISVNTSNIKANEAKTSATNALNYAKESESYAHGGTGTRVNEDIDNSKYYYEQAKSISESFAGTLRPKGTVNFSLFVDTIMSTASEGDMYNISDKFRTNNNFKEGSGLTIPAGSNIYKTVDGVWDVLAGSPVTSVNGERGDVYITPASIGLGNVNNTADANKNVATANQVNGTYTGGGGLQPPSYVTSGKTRFNMMHGFKGITNPSGNYMDVILMDNYTGSDVPFVTGIGVTKNNGNPRVFFANGAKGGTGNWAHQVEAITTGNIASQSVASATKATQDGAGNVISSTYLPKTGGTLTGTITAPSFNGNATSATNADTVDGKHASDLQNYNNLTNKPKIEYKNGSWANGVIFSGWTTDFQKIGEMCVFNIHCSSASTIAINSIFGYAPYTNTSPYQVIIPALLLDANGVIKGSVMVYINSQSNALGYTGAFQWGAREQLVCSGAYVCK